MAVRTEAVAESGCRAVKRSSTKRVKLPEIGTKMYSVQEHMYYVPGRAAPVLEYCVCEVTVRGFFTGGYTEVQLIGPNPKGHQTPYQYKISDIGKRIFYTPQEAALLAKAETEKYERIWGWTKDPPMRRTWEHLLEDTSC